MDQRSDAEVIRELRAKVSQLEQQVIGIRNATLIEIGWELANDGWGIWDSCFGGIFDELEFNSDCQLVHKQCMHEFFWVVALSYLSGASVFIFHWVERYLDILDRCHPA